MAFKAAVLGASGFGGGELLRLLEAHPALEVAAASASTHAGRKVTDVFPGLRALSGMSFCTAEQALETGADLVFSSLPHGESSKLLGEPGPGTVVDLAGDFRLRDASLYEQWYGAAHPNPSALKGWVYGLTEFHRAEIRATGELGTGGDRGKNVANPGCYAAASILALGPIVEAGLVETSAIHISAMSGVSGAGRAQGGGFDFISVHENLRPYKPVGHNHIAEIEQELSILAGQRASISFVPHLVPMNRGILVTAASPYKGPGRIEAFLQALRDRYAGEPFVRVLEPPALPDTRRVSGTNFAEVAVALDERSGKVLVFAALDNLGKGAAGQAIQNANLLLGLDETSGLLSQSLVA